MFNFCVFAGTTEGRELVEFLVTQPVTVTACVATEYGETLLTPAENLTISARRLNQEEMECFLEAGRFDLVIDATHPYAPIVTENIAAACETVKTEYLRLLRDRNAAPDGAVFVPDITAAVEFLNQTTGNILLTTGSKELAKYTGLQDFARRAYARVLPMEDSLLSCQQAGLVPSHILAMQGPFSREMNVAMLRSVNAGYMVTKEGGSTGGFEEKALAAQEAGVTLVVVGRPPQREGLCFSDTIALLCRRFHLTWKPKVTIVGIGPGSRAAMTEEVRAALDDADCVIGAGRMLDAVVRDSVAVFDAIVPETIAEYIRTHLEYTRFVVAMSGDVGFYSGTKKLLPLLKDCEVAILPGLSSMVYLCSRLGTSYEDVLPVSVHGRDHDIVPDVFRYPRIFALVGGENGMGKLCRRLTEAGLGEVKVSVGERLSYPDEKLTVGAAKVLARQNFQSLCVALIENAEVSRVVTHGLPDDVFQRGAGTDGVVPMTKSEVRSVCLSKLRLTDDAVCWDVGAGTGSVAIEMALQAYRGRVFAIERKEAAVELLRMNKERLGAVNTVLVPGYAPDACEDLPAPTHVFVGGSSGNMKEILTLALEKNPKARIVATAISLESVAELVSCMKLFDFIETEVVSLTVARDKRAGAYHLMTGQNPIYIFTMQGGTKIK